MQNITGRIRSRIEDLKTLLAKKKEESYIPTLNTIRTLVDNNTSECYEMEKALNLCESLLARIKDDGISMDVFGLHSEIQNYLNTSDYEIIRQIKPFGVDSDD